MCLLPAAACEATSRAAMTRLRAAFLDTLSAVPGIDWNVTFSSGFARPCDGVTPEALIALADAALYSAKQGGRDRDVFTTLGDPVARGEPA